jgi:HAD superfamily hydrolase (TIGR01509 family)
MKAIIFDCDGVIAETERDGHRVAFNRAFRELGLDLEWTIEQYGSLLEVAGGKDRARRWFEKNGYPTPIVTVEESQVNGTPDDGSSVTPNGPPTEEWREIFIERLHLRKTAQYLRIVESGSLEPRSGILRIMDDAAKAGVKLAIATTASKRSIQSIVANLLGNKREKYFSAILAGEDVRRKKPDGEIYEKAVALLGVKREETLVIEDSAIGLEAAKAAGLACLVTRSFYSTGENFSGAARVVDELGDLQNAETAFGKSAAIVTLDDLGSLLVAQASRV